MMPGVAGQGPRRPAGNVSSGELGRLLRACLWRRRLERVFGVDSAARSSEIGSRKVTRQGLPHLGANGSRAPPHSTSGPIPWRCSCTLAAHARPHQHQDPAVLELDAGRLPAAVAGLDPLAVSTSPGTCGTSRARRCDGGRMRSGLRRSRSMCGIRPVGRIWTTT